MKFEATTLEIFRKVRNRVRREDIIPLSYVAQQFNSILHQVVMQEREQELKVWLDMALKIREITGSFTYLLKEEKLEVKESPLPKMLLDRIDEIRIKWNTIFNQLVKS